jgi:hypothetical protein
MATPEHDKTPAPDIPQEEPLGEETLKRWRDRIADHLVAKWGPVAPPCPYCRITAWQIDPLPVVMQRFGGPAGFGVPAFLVWCGNCGHELHLSATVVGLWEEITGASLPEEAMPPDEPSDK